MGQLQFWGHPFKKAISRETSFPHLWPLGKKMTEEGNIQEGTTISTASWLQALCCAGNLQNGIGKSTQSNVAAAEDDARKAKYKLRYFDIRGLGEPIRMIFHYAGVPFEDERVKQSDWPNIKEMTRFGKLPELTINGLTHSQSMAIGRYLGKKFDLDGKTDLEKAKLDEAGDLLKDFMNEMSPYIGTALGMRDGEKSVLRKEIYLPTVKRYLPIFEQKLAVTGSGFLLVNGPSWTDFFLEEYLTTLEGIEKNVLKKYPQLSSFMRHIRELPQLKEYLEQRPESAL